MWFVGDIHGRWGDFKDKLNHADIDPFEQIIILGDVGLGFPGPHEDPEDFEYYFDHKVNFIRGNHDNPQVCKAHKSNLGDYGIIDVTIGFVAGGFSIDKDYRTPGMDWWYDEQLSEAELSKAIDLFQDQKPTVMLSHEAPRSIVPMVVGNCLFPSNTNSALDYIFRNVKSIKEWYFGHYHISFDCVVDGVHFHGLNCNEFLRRKE